MNRMKLLATVLCACALTMGVLTGCATTTTSTVTEEQALNRAYMSSVNQIMDDLDEQLESFVDAVSRNDVVAMQTQADAAFDILDELADLTVPEGLEEIHECYLAGAELLEQALDAYVDLYVEIDSASSDDDFDWSAYEDRLAEIQALYDEGVAQLEAGDEIAASLE